VARRTSPAPELVAFGRVLRRARRERDLSQEALAQRAGLAPKHVSEIERGNREPRLTTITRLAGGLGLGGGELLALLDEHTAAAATDSA